MLSTNLIVGLLVVIVVVLLFLAWQNQYCSDKHSMQARTLAGQTQALKADVKAAVKDVADVVSHTVQTVKKTVKDIVHSEPKREEKKKDAQVAALTELFIQENYEDIQKTKTKFQTIKDKLGVKPCVECPDCETKCVKGDAFGNKYPLNYDGLKSAYEDNCTFCFFKRFFLKTLGSSTGKLLLKKVFEKTLEDLIVEKAAVVMPATLRSKFCGTIGIKEGDSPLDKDLSGYEFTRIFGKTPEEQDKTLLELLNNVVDNLIDNILGKIPTVGDFILSQGGDIYTLIKGYLIDFITGKEFVKTFIKYLRRTLAFYLGEDSGKIKFLYGKICTGNCANGVSVNPNYPCWNSMLEARANKLETKALEDTPKAEPDDL